MSAMDVSSVDTDDNTNEDQIDDNLLEPLSEVSLNEREKNCTMTSKTTIVSLTTTKTTDKDPSSLPDSRAKMLHLQRIARSADSSSNDTVKSATSKKRHKSQSVGDIEKEETVSFSLESIIRRGLNDQKLKTNFNTNFKFGKPDDNISLRVNPTANLFYEIEDESGTDSSSDTYESSGERENTENTPTMTTVSTTTATATAAAATVTTTNNCITENGDLISSEPRRKRGRPKMSEEQKSLRAAQKETLRLHNTSTIEPNAMAPTQVDELMAMGHSMFSEMVPRKRGRPRLKREFNDEFSRFVGSTASSTPNRSQNDELSTTGVTSVSFGAPKVLRKRGRKPKSYHLEMARLNASAPLDNDTNEEQNERASTTLPLLVEPKRRGRKPRQIQDFYVKLEQPLTPAQYNQQVQPNDSNPPTLKKKRGRKPKAYHERLAAEKLNQSAPTAMLQMITNGPSNQNNITVTNSSYDMLVLAKRRGRKPKAYYEQLATLQPNSQNTSIMSNSTSTQSEKPSVSFSDTILSSDEPPAKKKCGRKPKSYHLALQLEQQQQQQQHQPPSILTNYSTPTVRPAGESSSHIPNNLPKKRGPKPGSKRVFHKSHVNMIPFHQLAAIRQPGIDITQPGFQIKKKRGRKPKNYQPEMEHHNGPVETNDYSGQLPIEVGLGLENHIATDSFASPANDEAFIKILQKQCDEIRILKQRISNLNPNEVEIESSEHIPEPPTFSYTKAEMCKAYCLQRQNIPMFANLHKQFSLPLPSVNEVREFVSKIQMMPGLQSTMLQMLDFDGKLIREYERFTILQISQVRTSGLFEYDDRLDRVWSHHKSVHMIVARGLYKEWSQLVYLSFDTTITKSNLFSAIEALHKINFPVVAVSTNFKEGKSDIFTEMSIGYGKNFFMHPMVPQKIFCFYYLSDLLEATNAHFCAGALSIEEKATRDAPETRTPLNKQTILLAIQGSYRRISIPREVLAWTDNTIKDLNFLEKFYSQFTLNMLQLTLQDNNVTKAIVEFVSIMKTFAEMMGRNGVYDSDSEVPDFDKFIDCQNRKINRFHDRIFKLQFANTSNGTKKFREAMLMSTVSLTMLRKSILEYYKHQTFSTAAITNELIRTKLTGIVPRSQHDKDLSPMHVCRALKSIFLDEDFGIKTEPKQKLFYKGAVAAAEINGKNEAFYASALLQWLCDEYTTKHPNANPNDVKDLKRKLKKTEENFCRIQNPNFRITDNVVAELSKRLTEENASDPSMDDILQIYIIQRLLLRIEYFNQNNISRIPNSVQVSIDLE